MASDMSNFSSPKSTRRSICTADLVETVDFMENHLPGKLGKPTQLMPLQTCPHDNSRSFRSLSLSSGNDGLCQGESSSPLTRDRMERQMRIGSSSPSAMHGPVASADISAAAFSKRPKKTSVSSSPALLSSGYSPTQGTRITSNGSPGPTTKAGRLPSLSSSADLHRTLNPRLSVATPTKDSDQLESVFSSISGDGSATNFRRKAPTSQCGPAQSAGAMMHGKPTRVASRSLTECDHLLAFNKSYNSTIQGGQSVANLILSQSHIAAKDVSTVDASQRRGGLYLGASNSNATRGRLRSSSPEPHLPLVPNISNTNSRSHSPGKSKSGAGAGGAPSLGPKKDLDILEYDPHSRSSDVARNARYHTTSMVNLLHVWQKYDWPSVEAQFVLEKRGKQAKVKGALFWNGVSEQNASGGARVLFVSDGIPTTAIDKHNIAGVSIFPPP